MNVVLNQNINTDKEKNVVIDSRDYFTPYSAGFFKLQNKSDLTSYNAKLNFISDSIKKIIFDFSTAEFIEENLGTKFGLSRIQKKEIANLIREILLGEVFIGDFIKSAKERLAVEESRAKEIAMTITAELFPPALEAIKRTQRVKFALRIQEMAKGNQAKSPQPLEAKPQVQVQPMTTPRSDLETRSDLKDSNMAKKSLEEELQKVASVIDLRNKPRE